MQFLLSVMNEYNINPCYFAEQKSRRTTAEIANAKLEFLKEEEFRLKHQMEIIFKHFLKAVENHTRMFYHSVVESTLPEKSNDSIEIRDDLETPIIALFNELPLIVKKHIDIVDLWAHKTESFNETLPFNTYMQFELPPLCIDKKVKEVLGYIASLLIKNKVIKINGNTYWVLECGSNFIIPKSDYNWSTEMLDILSVYEEYFQQLKILNNKIDSLKIAHSAA